MRTTTTKESPTEALARIERGASDNDAYVCMAFGSFPDVRPRENVLTFKAWKAKGRTVRKGQHGLALTVWIPVTKRDATTGETKPDGLRARTVHVFHVTQTDPIPEN